jgi:hypothetical protein
MAKGPSRKSRVRRLPRSRARGTNGRPHFEIYIIDSGWKTPAAEALRESLDLFIKYLDRHDVYILTADESEQFLQGHPQLLGTDPIVAVLDRAAIEHERESGVGVRLLLGRIHDRDRVQALLKMLLRIVNTRDLADDLPESVRRVVHREGITGAIEVIMSTRGPISAESGH